MKKSKYPDMPFSDFLSAVQTIPKDKNLRTVVFTGGEPLLRNDLEHCGSELRKLGFRWGMVSNGLLYNENRHNSLLNAGMGALTFSFDGLANEHNWLRNSKNSFKKVSAAIETAAKSNRLNFDVVTCVNKRNIGSLNEIYQYLKKKGVNAWRLFTIAPIGRARKNSELQLNAAQFKTLMDFIVACRKENQMDVKFSCEGYVGSYENQVREGFYFCRAGINIASVLIDGSISACPNIDRSFVQGNIYTHNLFDVWQNKFEIFRNHDWMKTGICHDCKNFSDCCGNGFHYRISANDQVLVCHNQLLNDAKKQIKINVSN